MIAKLKENRVYRSYTGGSRIDQLVHGIPGPDSPFPEDWLASTVRAFNPGREDIVEGYGYTAEGARIADLCPEGLPILVKLLDAAERLVIQVHPTRAFAREAFGSPVGKTESWLILDAAEDACVYMGFVPGITRTDWIRACEAQDVPCMLGMLHRFPVRKGDCIFVPGGVPHAIGGGCLMLETQEPSDLMVVAERVTPSGVVLSDAKIHGGLGFERMYDCYEYRGLSAEETRKEYFHPAEEVGNGFVRYLDAADNGIFSVMACRTREHAERVFAENQAIFVVLEGQGQVSMNGDGVPVKKGDRLLLTETAGKRLTLDTESGIGCVLALPAVLQ